MKTNAAKDVTLNAALAAAVLALACLSLSIGSVHLSLSQMWSGLVSGAGSSGIIMREIRAPRTLLAAEVGFVLGLSGACLQGLLRNPLADPAVFGAPQAAALGAVITIYFGLAAASSIALPIAAIVGAGASAAFIGFLASRGGGPIVLILAGLATGTMAAAGIALAINLSPNPFAASDIIFWLMGSFDDRSMTDVALASPFMIVACAVLFMAGAGLRALSLGDEVAESMGVLLPLLRFSIVAGVAVGVGAGVAVSGAIGFVGLVTPHVMRPFVNSDPRRLLVPSALAGSLLLLAADIGVRFIPIGVEIKVGVATALIGGPLFIWLALKRRTQTESVV